MAAGKKQVKKVVPKKEEAEETEVSFWERKLLSTGRVRKALVKLEVDPDAFEEAYGEIVGRSRVANPGEMNAYQVYKETKSYAKFLEALADGPCDGMEAAKQKAGAILVRCMRSEVEMGE